MTLIFLQDVDNDTVAVGEIEDDVFPQCSEGDMTTPSRPPMRKKSRLSGPDLIMNEAVSCVQSLRKKSDNTYTKQR